VITIAEVVVAGVEEVEVVEEEEVAEAKEEAARIKENQHHINLIEKKVRISIVL